MSLHSSAYVLTLWEISRGGKEGNTFFLLKSSYLEGETSHSWERFLIRNMASDVYFVISSDLEDVPPVLYGTYKQTNSHVQEPTLVS